MHSTRQHTVNVAAVLEALERLEQAGEVGDEFRVELGNHGRVYVKPRYARRWPAPDTTNDGHGHHRPAA